MRSPTTGYEQAVKLESGNSLYLNELGLLEDRLGNYKKAIGLFEQALVIDRAVYGEEHPQVAIQLNNLGAAWVSLGEHQKTIGLLEQAEAIFVDILGQGHPYTQSVTESLAQARAVAKE